MHYLGMAIQSIFFTCIIYLCDRSKRNDNFFYWFRVFILMLVGFIFIDWFFSSKAEASQPKSKIEMDYSIDNVPNSEYEILMLRSFLSTFRGKHYQLTANDIKYYKEQIDFHMKNGKRTYEDAQRKCWYLPDIDYRESRYRKIGQLT